jgi:hypothetical protein
MDRENLRAFFMEGKTMQTQRIEGKKKWAQPPWTPERRERHRIACHDAMVRYKQYEDDAKRVSIFYEKYGAEKVDELLELADELKTQGIDTNELLRFGIMVTKNKRDPLTDDQNLKAHELLAQKISAAEIYQQMFGAAG